MNFAFPFDHRVEIQENDGQRIYLDQVRSNQVLINEKRTSNSFCLSIKVKVKASEMPDKNLDLAGELKSW